MKSLFFTTALFFYLFVGYIGQANGQNYELSTISVEPYTNKIQRTGKLAFKRTLNLSLKSTGYLTALSVDEGDYFTKGQILARLDISELIEDKNAKYAQLLQAKRDVNRITKLIKNNLSSEQQLDNAKTLVETTRAAYKIAYYNLEKSQVVAPFAGIVLARLTERGELQTPRREILKVAAIKNNWVVKVALTDAEVSQVRLQQKVQVRLQNVMIKGVISKIPARATEQSNLFIIDVFLPELNRQPGMIAGQLAQVSIASNNNKFIYRIPISALVEVDKNGKAIIVTLTTSTQKLQRQTFDIYKLDNQFIYLLANVNDQPIQLITKGWQKLSLSSQ